MKAAIAKRTKASGEERFEAEEMLAGADVDAAAEVPDAEVELVLLADAISY